jgi:TctA family transporter
MERALRQSMMMYGGDFFAIFHRPISAVMLGLALLVLVMPLITYFNRVRVKAITEGG